MKKLLAIDIGTHTGYAMNDETGRIVAGTWNLATAQEITRNGKTRMDRRCDPRATGFFDLLHRINADVVVFEDVRFSSYTAQTQLWSTLRGVIWCAFHGRVPAVLIECVPVTTLKKFATGHGGATKEMMAKSLFRLAPEWQSANLNHDAIDAIWLHHWGSEHLKSILG